MRNTGYHKLYNLRCKHNVEGGNVKRAKQQTRSTAAARLASYNQGLTSIHRLRTIAKYTHTNSQVCREDATASLLRNRQLQETTFDQRTPSAVKSGGVYRNPQARQVTFSGCVHT